MSPRIFAKAQDHLSRGHDYEAFASRLGTAIARHSEKNEGSRVKYPYTYKVGGTEVFGTKSECVAATAAGAAAAFAPPGWCCPLPRNREMGTRGRSNGSGDLFAQPEGP